MGDHGRNAPLHQLGRHAHHGLRRRHLGPFTSVEQDQLHRGLIQEEAAEHLVADEIFVAILLVEDKITSTILERAMSDEVEDVIALFQQRIGDGATRHVAFEEPGLHRIAQVTQSLHQDALFFPGIQSRSAGNRHEHLEGQDRLQAPNRLEDLQVAGQGRLPGRTQEVLLLGRVEVFPGQGGDGRRINAQPDAQSPILLSDDLAQAKLEKRLDVAREERVVQEGAKLLQESLVGFPLLQLLQVISNGHGPGIQGHETFDRSLGFRIGTQGMALDCLGLDPEIKIAVFHVGTSFHSLATHGPTSTTGSQPERTNRQPRRYSLEPPRHPVPQPAHRYRKTWYRCHRRFPGGCGQSFPAQRQPACG